MINMIAQAPKNLYRMVVLDIDFLINADERKNYFFQPSFSVTVLLKMTPSSDESLSRQ